MKLNSRFFGMLLGLGLLPLCSPAQSLWVLSYQGTATTGGSGTKLTTQTVTENTFIQNCASNSAVSTSGLVMVLHFDADEVGDAIEVVNASDPNLFQCRVFRLAFPVSYTNSTGTFVKRFAYIYDQTSDHSRGSVVINRHLSGNGGTNTTTSVDGKVQFWLGNWNDSTNDPNAAVCSGTFTSKQSLP